MSLKLAFVVVVVILIICLVSKYRTVNSVNASLSGLWYTEVDDTAIYLFLNKAKDTIYLFIHDIQTGEVLADEMTSVKVGTKMAYLKCLYGDITKITYDCSVQQSDVLPSDVKLELRPLDLTLKVYDSTTMTDPLFTLYKNPMLQDSIASS